VERAKLDLPLTVNAVMHRQNLQSGLRTSIQIGGLISTADRLEGPRNVQYYGWALKETARPP